MYNYPNYLQLHLDFCLIKKTGHPSLLKCRKQIIFSSDIQISLLCVFLYEYFSRLDIVPHKHREHPVRFHGIINENLFYFSRFWIHGCVPKLLGRHFSESLEPCDCRGIRAADFLFKFFIRVNIQVLVPLSYPVQWWKGGINMRILYQLRHEPVEKGQQQGLYVLAIDICIRQQYYFSVS